MRCASCGSVGTIGASTPGAPGFGAVLDLGPMPLVNNLLPSADAACGRWPLEVVVCRSCSLVQLVETPPAEAMFDEYLYFSSQSRTMVEHAGRLVDRWCPPGARVLEVASNDGYLLAQARDRGCVVLGVDPARNIAAHAESLGVPTRCAYFDAATAEAIADEWGRCDVLFANNVLAHVPDPNQIAAGIKRVLAPDGTAHIEVPYVRCMIESGAFDTIYHEHRSYFSIAALASLFARSGLAVVGVDVVPIHGGSLHVRVRHDGDTSAVQALIAEERTLGFFEDRAYRPFAQKVASIRASVLDAIARFDRVAAYGAAAKGVVLLNAFGLDSGRIPWIADVSPHKQGRWVPGTRQAIVPPSRLVEAKPDAALLLPWNIREEIVRSNRGYLDGGGRFIVPIPEVVIV
jgi:SAM-dependent methyltransferase